MTIAPNIMPASAQLATIPATWTSMFMTEMIVGSATPITTRSYPSIVTIRKQSERTAA
ncbi:hypothetical protein LGN33_03420 [Burkholderia cepacia]|nr:hypothetical protein [Burkholderia cepacia]